ncbi:MAG: sulfatase [bacterium]|nr:sulfatase [bacterium]
MTRSSLKALAILAASALGTWGCSDSEQGTRGEMVLRFAEAAPEDFLNERSLFEAHEAFDWGLGSRDAGSWSVEAGGARVTHGRQVVEVSATDAPITLTRAAEIAASDVHAFEIAGRGLGKRSIRLCWAGKGEDFEESRCVAQAGGAGARRFEVARHALWTGDIERVQLRFGGAPRAGEVRVRRVRGLRYEAAGERLASALGRGFRVTLDRGLHEETRTALLAPPGLAMERRLLVPPRSELSFAFGLQTGVRDPVSFQVLVRRRAGSEPEAIFEQTIEATGSGGGWRAARVDLSELAGEEVDVVLRTEAGEDFDLARGFPLWGHPEIARRGGGQAPNVILVSLDTLRADHLSLYGYERQTSPHIDSWARRCGTMFETAVAASPWTIPSHVSMLTGLDALRHGVNHPTGLAPSMNTLAEYLREAGYTTFAVTGGGYLNSRFGFLQGFDRYLSWGRRADSEAELERGIDELLESLEERGDGPFFAFFHTYEAHVPYRPRQPYLSRFRPEASETSPRPIGTRDLATSEEEGFEVRREWVWLDDTGRPHEGQALEASELDWGRDLYDSGIGHLDAQLGRLFESLENLDLERDTIVVVTSDHGESLGEQDRVGHTSVHDVDLLVPLVVSLPGCELGGGRVSQQVRTVDIVPTVLDLVGVEAREAVDGASLVPLIEGRQTDFPQEAWSYTARHNRGVSLRIGNRLKYIFNNTVWGPARGRETLYRLRDDPGETNNLSATEPATAEARRRVQERLSAPSSGLRLRFGNQASEPFRARISGKLRPSRVKSWNLPADRLRRMAGGVVARVEPGEAFDLVLEIPSKDPPLLEVTFDPARWDDAFSARLSADLATRRIRYAADAWSEEPQAEAGLAGEGLTGVIATWSKVSESTQEDPSAVDPDLLQQLRALGYVP